MEYPFLIGWIDVDGYMKILPSESPLSFPVEKFFLSLEKRNFII